MVFAIRCDDPRRAQGSQQGVTSGTGQTGVERRRGIARVPDGAQRIDETGSSGKVQCDEFRHWPVA